MADNFTAATLEGWARCLKENEPHLAKILLDYAKGWKLEVESLRGRLKKWETELSAVMPADKKDWWQNNREEWPEVARSTIENLRHDRDLAWELLDTEVNRE